MFLVVYIDNALSLCQQNQLMLLHSSSGFPACEILAEAHDSYFGDDYIFTQIRKAGQLRHVLTPLLLLVL